MSIRAGSPRTRKSQAAAQMYPATPMTTKDARQPNCGSSHWMMSGVTTAPTAAPELKIPFPSPDPAAAGFVTSRGCRKAS